MRSIFKGGRFVSLAWCDGYDCYVWDEELALVVLFNIPFLRMEELSGPSLLVIVEPW